MMDDPNKAHQALVREIYTLGKYLTGKKYRLLRCGYLAFVTGLFASGAVLLAKVIGS